MPKGKTRAHQQEPVLVTSNGRYHEPPVWAGMFQRVEVWLKPKFDDDEVAAQWPSDWLFCFWKNHPMHLRRRLYGTAEGHDSDEMYTALTTLVPAHNGWTWMDHEGNVMPYPPASDRAFWDEIPNEVYWAIQRAMTDEITRALPNLLTRMPDSSVSTSSSAKPAEIPQETPSLGSTLEAS